MNNETHSEQTGDLTLTGGENLQHLSFELLGSRSEDNSNRPYTSEELNALINREQLELNEAYGEKIPLTLTKPDEE